MYVIGVLRLSNDEPRTSIIQSKQADEISATRLPSSGFTWRRFDAVLLVAGLVDLLSLGLALTLFRAGLSIDGMMNWGSTGLFDRPFFWLRGEVFEMILTSVSEGLESSAQLMLPSSMTHDAPSWECFDIVVTSRKGDVHVLPTSGIDDWFIDHNTNASKHHEGRQVDTHCLIVGIDQLISIRRVVELLRHSTKRFCESRQFELCTSRAAKYHQNQQWASSSIWCTTWRVM